MRRFETDLINDCSSSSSSPHSPLSASPIPNFIPDPRAFISKPIMEKEREGNNKGRGA